VNNVVLDSITEHIETDGCFLPLPPDVVECESNTQLQTPSAEYGTGTEFERSVFARHSSFQAVECTDAKEFEQKSLVDEGRPHRYQGDVKIDVDDDRIESGDIRL
jgi:hypothetical protein